MIQAGPGSKSTLAKRYQLVREVRRGGMAIVYSLQLLFFISPTQPLILVSRMSSGSAP